MAAFAIPIILFGAFFGAVAFALLRRSFLRKNVSHVSLRAGIWVLIGLCTVAGWILSSLHRDRDPSSPVVVVLLICMIGTFIFYGYLVKKSYQLFRNTLRRKGRKSPAVLTVAELFCGALLLIGFFLVRHMQEPLLAAAALVIVVFLVGALASSLLDVRALRTDGPRSIRFPYRKAGYVLIGFTIAAPITAFLLGQPKLSIGITALLFSMSQASFAIARRASAPPAHQVMTEDNRRPVLFLRPFAGEEQIFAKENKTLEQYLADEIRLSIGPFIALGNPEDFVAPMGAARLYVEDARWQDAFCEIARRAALILMVVGVSEHVMWELRRLKEERLTGKLFVLTKPRLGKGSSARGKEDRLRRIAWSDFTSALRREGYQAMDEDPGPGSVMGFDAEARAALLQVDAKTPAETVRPMIEQMRLANPSTRDLGKDPAEN
jgi:hypothetical protein